MHINQQIEFDVPYNPIDHLEAEGALKYSIIQGSIDDNQSTIDVMQNELGQLRLEFGSDNLKISEYLKNEIDLNWGIISKEIINVTRRYRQRKFYQYYLRFQYEESESLK